MYSRMLRTLARSSFVLALFLGALLSVGRNWHFFLCTDEHVVQSHAEYAAKDGEIAKPFKRALPKPHREWNMRVSWQSAVEFRMLGVVQNVDDVGASDTYRVVNSGVAISGTIS